LLLLIKDDIVEIDFFLIPIVVVIQVGILVGLILGITALIQIKLSRGCLDGTKRAAAALIISTMIIITAFGSLFAVARKYGSKLVCGSNVKGLGTVIKVYAHEYDGRLPTASNWCDLLIAHADVDPRAFRCPESDARVGESTYALNENVVGMKLSEIPGDVVLMFETGFGRTEEGRAGRVKYRQYFKPFIERQQSIERKQRETRKGDDKVYILRWNQVGGPEDLKTEYHKYIGCNVLFADCSARFIKTEDLDTLRWEP